jgi:hypothetical protein
MKRNYGDTVELDKAPELRLIEKPIDHEDILTYDPKEGLCIRRRKIKPHQIKKMR